MEIRAFMSAQVTQLQQALQMSILDESLNMGAAGVVDMLERMPEQQPATHPYKGQVMAVSYTHLTLPTMAVV